MKFMGRLLKKTDNKEQTEKENGSAENGIKLRDDDLEKVCGGIEIISEDSELVL